jgi:serine/threonine-protein phosphatase 4 regulatory subunit 1
MEDRRSYAARAFDTLINSGNLVQYTALEILGEIVHLFHGDPLGPPQELLDVYFSQSEILEPQDETTGHDTDVVRQFTDPDRAVVSAYNVSEREHMVPQCLTP